MRGVGASTRTWEIIDSIPKVENPLMCKFLCNFFLQLINIRI